ncbi:hypothetical protein F5B22DRAFT_652574 [Xylaria bambusicola]|uniref:uncharacterized protein n=1 Tax=Xylaria bambusicola TaxID=326684 RepID=UPI002007927C|nr:uncharacterized protein F5B22DRAFT_652574 [Xylaria bambusicola]KAI0502963.1 hypothetical protein F5B22DRAFT_652574 [Xylaria bambusicola]
MSSSPWREEHEEVLGLMGCPTTSVRTVYYKKHSIFLCGVVSLLALAVITIAALLVVVSSHVASQGYQESPPWLPPRRPANVTFSFMELTAFEEGGGFVWFNGTQVQSPPGSERLAVVSVFHQLHCLEMIRIGYFVAIDSDLEIVDQGPDHFSHCWDYLHQAIKCHRDTTLEWVHEGDPGSSGWGYEHQCTDFEALCSWVEAHPHPHRVV